jgi:adenosylcobinamide-GDP ribazoletransferase
LDIFSGQYVSGVGVWLVIKGLKSLFSFLTIVPVGMESIEDVSRYFFLCPLVGLVIGFVAGVVGFVSGVFLPGLICGFLVLVSVQLVTGFHHLDGLLDLSDAAMARGDSKRRLEVMHDMFTGAAAVAAGVIVLVVSGLAFGYFSGLDILRAAVVAEVVAKESMVLTAYMGKLPSYKGMGYYVVESMKGKHLKALFSVVLSAVIVFLLVGISVMFVFVAMEIVVVALSVYANETLGFVTGDIMGATNEINRMVALLVVLAAVG